MTDIKADDSIVTGVPHSVAAPFTNNDGIAPSMRPDVADVSRNASAAFPLDEGRPRTVVAASEVTERPAASNPSPLVPTPAIRLARTVGARQMPDTSLHTLAAIARDAYARGRGHINEDDRWLAVARAVVAGVAAVRAGSRHPDRELVEAMPVLRP